MPESDSDYTVHFAAADKRHKVPLGVRRACASAPGFSVYGHRLTKVETLINMLSSVHAFLLFSDGWTYCVDLDSLPEESEARKAPSRWGAVFARSPDTVGVEDPGNKLYAKVLFTVQCWALTLECTGAPLQGIARKTNVKKLNERCGDIVEAVLGRPLLRRHLEAGGVER